MIAEYDRLRFQEERVPPTARRLPFGVSRGVTGRRLLLPYDATLRARVWQT